MLTRRELSWLLDGLPIEHQWKNLVRYLDSGLLDIDNNAAERSMNERDIHRFIVVRTKNALSQVVSEVHSRDSFGRPKNIQGQPKYYKSTMFNDIHLQQ